MCIHLVCLNHYNCQSMGVSVYPHQCSVSNVVPGGEDSSTGDGAFIQCVAIGLAIATVDREILHVHWSL